MYITIADSTDSALAFRGKTPCDTYGVDFSSFSDRRASPVLKIKVLLLKHADGRLPQVRMPSCSRQY